MKYVVRWREKGKATAEGFNDALEASAKLSGLWFAGHGEACGVLIGTYTAGWLQAPDWDLLREVAL